MTTRNLLHCSFLFLLLLCVACKPEQEDALEGEYPGSKGLLLNPLQVNGNKVTLTWKRSFPQPSNEYWVYRYIGDAPKESPYERGNNLGAVNADDTLFVDSTAPYCTKISYRIVASDKIYSNARAYERTIPTFTFNTGANYYATRFINYDPATGNVVVSVRESGHLMLMNPETGKSMQINAGGSIGKCGFGLNYGIRELYVPRSDGWLLVYKQDDLSLIDQIKVSPYPLIYVAYNNGSLFISSGSDYAAMYMVDRNSKAAKSVLPAGDFGYTDLRCIPNTATSLFGIKGSGLNYYLFNSTSLVKRLALNSPDYGSPFTFALIPLTQKMITNEGHVFDNALQHVQALPTEGVSFNAIAVDDQKKVYAAAKSDNRILVFDLNSNQLIDASHYIGGKTIFMYNKSNSIYAVQEIFTYGSGNTQFCYSFAKVSP